ncbi:MAG: DNA polymerase III subunit gamma/tau, partial [Clostridia bacterium]|nr:DNA polymerase III subunit gamma/tau [Clostridia bacterium]
MAYLALYRRFRPSGFESVIGQDAIVKTLTNQIMTDKIGHAYLFCGARGTGKTSLAKIFAKAVNCLESVNGSPCGKCSVCKALQDPSNVDIIEMDAASNNKVENVRDIRESVQYPPVSGKYKVYIIDEVHMLTTEAFNALLKTLEEPPKHAIFILATTESHKLPATILSRCMRFDFKLIPTKKIAELIANIYDEVGKTYDMEAVNLIAKSGEGSVRDALSVADLCVSYGQGKLTYSDVLTVLGSTDLGKIDGLIKAVFEGDTGSVLTFTDELSTLGKSIGLLSKDVVNYLRDITVIKTAKNAKDILALPDDRYLAMKQVADMVDGHRILRCNEILSSIETSLRYSTQPRAVLETALIKASMPDVDYNIDALLSRIKVLEEKLANFELNGVTKTVVEEKVVKKV